MNSENNHSNQKMDLRVFKTYKALTEAIFRLLETYDFEDISVNKLCEKAYVGRGTFYKHFADKYEFLSFVIREQYLIYLNKELSSIQSDTPTDYYLGLISICIDFCEQYPLLISAWHQSKSLFILTNVVSEIVIPDIKKESILTKKMGMFRLSILIFLLNLFVAL